MDCLRREYIKFKALFPVNRSINKRTHTRTHAHTHKHTRTHTYIYIYIFFLIFIIYLIIMSGKTFFKLTVDVATDYIQEIGLHPLENGLRSSSKVCATFVKCNTYIYYYYYWGVTPEGSTQGYYIPGGSREGERQENTEK